MVLDPAGYSVVEWTDYVNLGLAVFGTIPILWDEKSWQDWAAAVIALPGISAFNPPNPFNYSQWQLWADDFNKAVDINL